MVFYLMVQRYVFFRSTPYLSPFRIHQNATANSDPSQNLIAPEDIKVDIE